MANNTFDPRTSTDAAALGRYYMEQMNSQFPPGYFDTPEGKAAAAAGAAWGQAARIPTTFGGGGSWFDSLVDKLQQNVLEPIGNSAINMGALSVPLFALGANGAAGNLSGLFGGGGSSATIPGGFADATGLIDNPANYGGGFAAQGIADPSLATSVGNYVSDPVNYLRPAVTAATSGGSDNTGLGLSAGTAGLAGAAGLAGGTASTGGSLLDTALKYAPLIGTGVNALGSIMGSKGQTDAALQAGQLNADAANRAIDLQKYMYDTTRADQAPWLKAGTGAIGQLDQQRQAGTGAFGPDFGMAQFQQDPGYGFRLSEGLKAIKARQAAGGQGLIGANTMKGLQDYGQQAASQEYQNAYNRYTQNQQNQYNRLAGLAGTGQVASNQLANAGQNYAGSAGNAIMQGANARAGGLVGAAASNASGYQNVGNALTSGYNAYQNQQLMNRLLGGGGLVASNPWGADNYLTSGTTYGLDALNNAYNYGVGV